MPGISDVTAQVIVSEIGSDMSRFPTAGHLVSWARLCPRNDESAGEDDVGAVAADPGYLLPFLEGKLAEIGDGLADRIPGQAVSVKGVERVSPRRRIDLGQVPDGAAQSHELHARQLAKPGY